MVSLVSNIIHLRDLSNMPKDVVEELFEKIGAIGAKVDDVRDKQLIIDSKLTTMGERDVRLEGKVDAAHSRLDKLEPIVDQHQALKNKGLGIVLTLSIIGSFLGFLISMFGAAIMKLITGD